MNLYYENECDFNCKNCDKGYDSNLCNGIKLLISKENALNYKRNIYRKKRKKKSKKELQYDYIFLLHCTYYFYSPISVLWNKYDFLWEWDDLTEEEQKIQLKKIRDIKTKIKKTINLQKDDNLIWLDKQYTYPKTPEAENRVRQILQTISTYSFNKNDLEIYIKCLEYFYTKKSFILSEIKNMHKHTTFNGNWLELFDKIYINNSFLYTGNSTAFITHFASTYKLNKSHCVLLLTYFNTQKCFSYCDIEYIISNFNKKNNFNISITNFFDDLKIINKFNKK